MLKATAMAAAAAVTLVFAAQAADRHDHSKIDAPYIRFELGFQLRFDWAFASDDPADRIKQLFIDHGEAQIRLQATEWLGLQTHFMAEAVRPPRPGRDAWFRGFGLFLEEIYLDLDFKGAALIAGKFNPAFGIAHDDHLIRGIAARDFTEDYKLTEMTGFGVTLRPDLRQFGLGRHELTGQVFFADTTFLNHSIITTPRNTDESFERLGDRRFGDGGLANTNRLDNFAFSLSGRDLGFLPDLGYSLGFRLLRASPAGLAAGVESVDETGYSAALDYQIRTTSLFASETVITPLIEWVHLRNAGGNPGVVNYFTLAVSVETGPWELWLAGTLRNTSAVPDMPDVRDRLFAVSLDYAVKDWLKLGGGYRYARVNGLDTHAVGLRLMVHTDFDIPLR